MPKPIVYEDIWGAENDKVEKTKSTSALRRFQRRAPSTNHRVAATQVIHRGGSYHPSQEDYDAALKTMVDRASKEEKKEEELWNATFGRVPAPNDSDDEDDDESEESDDDDDGAEMPRNPPRGE